MWGGRYDAAVVQLIRQHGRALHVLDFKTSRSRWGQAKASKGAEQMQLYRALAGSLAWDNPIHLHFGVLVKTKTPSTQLLDVPSVDDSAERPARFIRPVWRAMQLGVDYANPSMTACGGCPYRDHCPAVG